MRNLIFAGPLKSADDRPSALALSRTEGNSPIRVSGAAISPNPQGLILCGGLHPGVHEQPLV